MIIDCVSDTHGNYPELTGGDLLIVAGDLTARDTLTENAYAISWMAMQKYKKIVFIAGNHDNFLQDYGWDDSNYPEYLCDSGTEFCYYPPLKKDAPDGALIERRDFKIWGSPWSLWFEGINPKCTAFTVKTEEELADKWGAIPDDTDILITHSPAYGFGDKVERRIVDEKGHKHKWMESVGSKSLLKWVANHAQTLKMHVFGHVHEGYAMWDSREIKRLCNDPIPSPILVNASHVNERYEPVNKPVRIVL